MSAHHPAVLLRGKLFFQTCDCLSVEKSSRGHSTAARAPRHDPDNPDDEPGFRHAVDTRAIGTELRVVLRCGASDAVLRSGACRRPGLRECPATARAILHPRLGSLGLGFLIAVPPAHFFVKANVDGGLVANRKPAHAVQNGKHPPAPNKARPASKGPAGAHGGGGGRRRTEEASESCFAHTGTARSRV
jgi:hypothetical protein